MQYVHMMSVLLLTLSILGCGNDKWKDFSQEKRDNLAVEEVIDRFGEDMCDFDSKEFVDDVFFVVSEGSRILPPVLENGVDWEEARFVSVSHKISDVRVSRIIQFIDTEQRARTLFVLLVTSAEIGAVEIDQSVENCLSAGFFPWDYFDTKELVADYRVYKIR